MSTSPGSTNPAQPIRLADPQPDSTVPEEPFAELPLDRLAKELLQERPESSADDASGTVGREVPEVPVEGSVDTPTVIATPGGVNFIDAYAAWADVLEFPPAVHDAIAIQLIASVLNRAGVIIDRGAFQLSMDLWLGIIAESGAGKNTVINPARELLDAAGIPDLIDSTDWGSKEKLYEIFSGASGAPDGFDAALAPSGHLPFLRLD